MAEKRVFTNSLDAAVLKKFGGATCSCCHKTAIVRDSDMLCFMCWSDLGEPESPNVIRPKPTFDTSMRKQ